MGRNEVVKRVAIGLWCLGAGFVIGSLIEQKWPTTHSEKPLSFLCVPESVQRDYVELVCKRYQ